MKRTEQPSRRTKVFNYTKFQWAEIEASIAAVRDASLTETERELLLGAAMAYFSPPPPHSIQARKWSALATLVSKTQELLADCLSDFEGEPGADGATEYYFRRASEALIKLRKDAIYHATCIRNLGPGRAILITPLAGSEECLRVAHLSLDPTRTPKLRYQTTILEIWADVFGGRLNASWDESESNVRGEVVRYFQAVAGPVMGEAMSSLKSLPRIVSRERVRRKNLKLATRIPPEEGGQYVQIVEEDGRIFWQLSALNRVLQ